MDIKNIKIFSGIRQDIEKRILDLNIKEVEYLSGDCVVKNGEPLTAALIIEKGGLKAVEYMIDGKEIVSSYYFAADAFPFYLYFGGTKKFPYDVYAIGKTKVCFLPLKEFQEIMESDLHLMKNILEFIAEYTCFNKLVIRATQYNKINQRLAYWLLHRDEVDRLKLPKTQEMLADILRCNRPSLNQELKKFEEDGIIKFKGVNIEILDLKGLSELV